MTGPYSLAAADYYHAGWSPIPLPPREKYPPPKEFTGSEGKYIDEVTLKRLCGARSEIDEGKRKGWKSADGNIALRLHQNFIGIDVDMYDGKAGRETFNAAIEAWGPLPDTWYTSARTDGSGIRLFRIPEGLAWPGKLPQGGGVELVTWYHRYAICSPSIHPDTGKPYVWRHTERGLLEDEIPELDDVPFLPQSWIDGLTSGKEYVTRSALDMDDDAVNEWLEERPGGKPCTVLARTLSNASRKVRVASDEGGAHDAGRDGAWGLIGDAHSGHAGVVEALDELQKVFTKNVASKRGTDGDRIAKGEWARIVVRGVQKVAAEGESEDACVCTVRGDSAAAGTASGSSGGDGGDSGGDSTSTVGGPSGAGRGNMFDFSRNDGGNAERLVLARRHDMRLCPALGGWYVWNGSRWEPDPGNARVTQWARDMVRDMESEASEIDDPKQHAAFMSWVRGSGNASRLSAMIDLAGKEPGMMVPASYFDGNPEYLGVANGLLRLTSSGPVERVPAQQEHRLTLSTGVPYMPAARSDLWDSFLSRCQPDVEVRAWLQKLVGYSLLGGNPERLFIVAFGPTSTGKTTFMEAVRSALGGYAGPMNLSLLRDNQDERPRADIVEALDRRFLFAEEASHEWKLHPDQIKRVTGGTMLKARRPHAKDYIEKVPAFTPWLVTNSAPHIEGVDPAFIRRLRVVSFDQTIDKAEEIASYRDELCSSAREAVLAWCVRGWEMYRESPDLSTPAGALAAFASFRNDLSDFDIMLREICDFGEAFCEKPVALYNAYQRWCEVSGVSQREKMTNSAFGRALNSGYPKKWMRVDKKQVEVRTGLRLNEAYRSIVPEALTTG